MGAVWRSDKTSQDGRNQRAPTPKSPRKSAKGRRKAARRLALLVGVSLLAGGGYLGWQELESSRWQSKWLSRYAADLDFVVKLGPSPRIQFPEDGPFDRRLGYVDLPRFIEQLSQRNFRVEEQARFSRALLDYTNRGFFPPYPEESQAGLTINDCRGVQLYANSYPRQYYERFEDIPPLVVMSLLFIEDRGLLDISRPNANPAVDWPRFTKAAISQLEKRLGLGGQAAGGSTLATQVEKYRHSPEGRTGDPQEKIRQMVSASVRTYREGPQTLATRQRIVRDYLNSVPLSAAPGHGEVHGIADGLRLWFGADFREFNRLLDPRSGSDVDAQARGLALRQVLSLLIAQRRPSYYLGAGREEMLGLPLYDLDRLDLTASTPLQGDLQAQISEYLVRLADPAFAETVGLFGDRMLSPEKTADVRYSFTLFERGEEGFRVRVQTDNTNQPFDINEGSKLELGSTAKLRVLTTYLEVIAELHQRYSDLTPSKLRKIGAKANLSRWAIDYLATNSDRSLDRMLDAALERRYSASPAERFFTGAGMHRFGNFRREDDGRIPTVRESLRESINLPFVRMMRDLVSYSTHETINSAELLNDDKDPRRQEYLTRFADREGSVFLQRFWKKYRDKTAEQRIETFLQGMRPTPVRLAAVHRYLMPDAERPVFDRFLKQHLPTAELSDKQLDALYNRYGPGAYSLPDQAYIARTHPLDLWLLGYLIAHPQATLSEVVADSRAERQEVYGWLFRSRHKSARDSRIRIMLEVEAFTDIHRRWQRLGYPFDNLVPSFATALGSSGDRPAALAELMGIILNDGVRQPSVRIDSLHFAEGTPYETRMGFVANSGKRVMPVEVARALQDALASVVEGGTARRLRGSFVQVDGSDMRIGGKTGTGDNRIQSVGAGGRLISSLALNRTATLVFYLGPNHFGTLTAYVPGRGADSFRFTSALPVQTLKGMAPILLPYLQGQSTLCRPDKSPTLTSGMLSAEN